jgi:hypothetical protein
MLPIANAGVRRMRRLPALASVRAWLAPHLSARLVACFLVSLVALPAIAPAQDTGSLAAIQQKLRSQFKLTKVTADRSEIVTAGDVVVLHKENITMNSTATVPAPENVYKDGRIQTGGWANAWRNSLAKSSNGDQPVPNRMFVAGEKAWVVSTEVKEDGVYIVLLSDPFDDIRYYGLVKFPFVKKQVPPLDALMKQVDAVLTVDAQSQDQAAQPAAQETAPAPAAPPAAQAAAPLPAIAPPPPPPDAPPPTVSLGETTQQITAAFGKPVKAAKLGVKEIYYYKDMKVTFTNNKVSNVE